MDSPAFCRLPTEIMEQLACILRPTDLAAFRLTCVQANVQTFRVMAERFFSSLRTSLVGDDFRKFEEIATNTALSKYIKVVCLEDGVERFGDFLPPKTSHIWPRDDKHIIQSQSLGVAGLRHLLANHIIQPKTIVIRDYRDGTKNVDCATVEPAVVLMQEIIDRIPLAILSMEQIPLTAWVAEAVLQLSPEHQGQEMESTLLRSARLRRNNNRPFYWLERVLYESPALEDLHLSYSPQSIYNVSTDAPVEGALPTRPVQFRLKNFSLCAFTVTGPGIIMMLQSSFDTLSQLSLRGTTLARPSTWREVLSTIAQRCSMLTEVELKVLKERGSSDGKNIKFGSISIEDFAEQYRSGLNIRVRGPMNNRRITSVSYKGLNACNVLGIFAAAIE